MDWIWIIASLYFTVPKIGLFPGIMLVDRMIPSVQLMARNCWALWKRLPLDSVMQKPARLNGADRYSIYVMVFLVNSLIGLFTNQAFKFPVELLLSCCVVPMVQPKLIELAKPMVAWRNKRFQRLAAKCVVRTIKYLSLVILEKVPVLHSSDIMPHLEQAPQILIALFKHAAFTLLILLVKHYSPHYSYRLLTYAYLYKTDHLLKPPSREQAKQQLRKLIGSERWSWDDKTIGLLMMLFLTTPDLEPPRWVLALNFLTARLFAQWTLLQVVQAWHPESTFLSVGFALLLINRDELVQYWKTVLAVGCASVLHLLGFSGFVCALVATSRPIWFGFRSVIKLVLKRLLYAIELQLPAFWMLSATLIEPMSLVSLALYCLCLPFPIHALIGLATLAGAAMMDSRIEHLLLCAFVQGALYTAVCFSGRPPPTLQPKIHRATAFTVIEDYKTT